jgi:O-antigen/teichoic acid export membrane protein
MFGYKKLHIVALARIWNLFSGLLLVFAASNVFTATEQGAFYTFLSLGAAQFFFDLGIGFVLANLAGRKTPEDRDGVAYGDLELEHVKASVRFGLKWSLISGVTLFLVLGTIGWYVFTHGESDTDFIRLIWIAYVALVAFAMSFHLFLRLFEGLGFVVETAIARSIQSFVNIAVIYVVALTGIGIIALPIALAVALITASFYFMWCSEKIRSTFKITGLKSAGINWREDIWPFQSRVAVTWISGYIIFQAQTPILFLLSSGIEAGKFGIAVQIFQALNTSANIFLTYNIREWTRFSANNDLNSLNRSFMKTLVLTCTLMAVGCLCVILGFWAIHYLGWAMAKRFPDMELLLLFSIAATFNQVFFCLGYYFRARGIEPLWWISTLAALVILLMPVLLWNNYSIAAATWSFFGVSVLLLGLLAPVYSYFLIRKLDKMPLPIAVDSNVLES